MNTVGQTHKNKQVSMLFFHKTYSDEASNRSTLSEPITLPHDLPLSNRNSSIQFDMYVLIVSELQICFQFKPGHPNGIINNLEIHYILALLALIVYYISICFPQCIV